MKSSTVPTRPVSSQNRFEISAGMLRGEERLGFRVLLFEGVLVNNRILNVVEPYHLNAAPNYDSATLGINGRGEQIVYSFTNYRFSAVKLTDKRLNIGF
jgi:hypothetical protein